MSKSEVKNQGKVIKSTRNHYLVQFENKILKCVVRGKIVGKSREDLSAVKVGDNVIVTEISGDEGVIQKILPRRSKLSRTVEGKAYREHIIAANIDQMVIIMSVKQPAFKWGLLDRYLIIAEKNKLHSVICLNKIDLAQDDMFLEVVKIYQKLKYDIYFTSVITGRGLNKLSSALKSKVSILVGHSGVGKSSLLQKIEPEATVRISEISEKTAKGKHTTSFVELFPLSFGGYIIDTPGIRELGLWDIYRDELKKYFIEFQQIQAACQFNDCMHLKEPGCAVKEAVNKNRISKERYKNYQNIYDDLRAAPYELIKRR
ncbi:MAG: ribosome small subunit-dependent GTPase A [Calditrichia bacterium]|nr:ribosome small subunit-dependent GTPase A [Calditrichia bacterium]